MNLTHYYLATLTFMLLHNLQAIQMLSFTSQAQTLLVSSICNVKCQLNTFCDISQKVYQVIYTYVNFACMP